MVEIDEFDHVDPNGICDIHKFGKVKPALAGFVVENEDLRFAKSGGKLFCCQAFLASERDENFSENVDAVLMVWEEVHEV